MSLSLFFNIIKAGLDSWPKAPLRDDCFIPVNLVVHTQKVKKNYLQVGGLSLVH